ncbi:uncharacterized protein G2W53_008780 [Senna tora]|uniref:Uncharacterized protein n=1 Tax=Senna tora TaxID=362788 RepID=A0A835C6U3_9FABA|nr:uncharacterized protein G2W53_008780 [Senna tora]
MVDYTIDNNNKEPRSSVASYILYNSNFHALEELKPQSKLGPICPRRLEPWPHS